MQYKDISEELKNEIVNFYLIPKTKAETADTFHISFYLLDRIFKEKHIEQHSLEVRDQLGKEQMWANNIKKYGAKSPFALKEVQEKGKQTYIAKYGTDNPAKLESTKEKARNTCQEKYGTDCPLQVKQFRDKGKITKLGKYGDPNFTNREQAAQTNLQKYGVKSYAQTEEYKQKVRETDLTKYGAEWHIASESVRAKSQATCQEKYGQNTFTGSEQYLQKVKEVLNNKYGVDYTWQIPEVQEKSKATNQEKYGVDFYTSSEDFKEKLKKSDPIRIEKIFSTKAKNGTITSSNVEDLFYKKLLEVFDVSDIIRQYKDNRYPFHCDFYIKSLDLFIELNLIWTHGGHPFTNSEQDKLKLEYWQKRAKTSKYYQDAIKTWTERDVNKLKFAKENNLNYIVFYSMKELNNFNLKNLKGENK